MENSREDATRKIEELIRKKMEEVYKNKKQKFRIVPTLSHPQLAKDISDLTGIKMIKTEDGLFANGEMRVEFTESVRDKKLIIVGTGAKATELNPSVSSKVPKQTTPLSLNDHLMEMFLLIDGAKTHDAKAITVISADYPYGRADKNDHRGPISSACVSRMFTSAGATRLMAVDLHAGQTQGTTSLPFDNLFAIGLFVKYLEENHFKGLTPDEKKAKFVLVHPDAGAVKRGKKYAQKLGLEEALAEKSRSSDKTNQVDEVKIVMGKEFIPGRTAVIIDDLIDSAGTTKKIVEACMAEKAQDVIVMATHPVFSLNIVERINSIPGIVVVCDTIPLSKEVMNTGKVKVISVAPLFAEAIKRLVTGESISAMFESKSKY